MTYIMLNHRAVPAQEATVPVQDRGFRYGDGVFETIAVAHGAAYRFGWHMDRLARALAAAKIKCDVAVLRKECTALLSMNGITDGLLRIQVTRGSGGRGYLPAKLSVPTVVIETVPMPEFPEVPVSLWLSSYRRIPAEALPSRMKLCQGMNSTLARMEAEENHCFDALQLNMQGDICETSSGNIFWLEGNILYTPSLECGGVEGGIRAAILELSPYKVEEIAATPETLKKAQALIITNVAWIALPVAALQPSDMRWESASLAAEIRSLLEKDMRAQAASKGA